MCGSQPRQGLGLETQRRVSLLLKVPNLSPYDALCHSSTFHKVTESLPVEQLGNQFHRQSWRTVPFPEGFVAWVAAVGYFNISWEPALSSRGLGMLQRTLCMTMGLLAEHSASSAPAQSELLRTLKPSEQPWTKRFDPEEEPGCTSASLEANLSHSRLLNSTKAPTGICNPSGCATALLQALPHFPSLQHRQIFG